jgi:phthalate 4,5-cis-dihydrodiol dehydrogenase
LTSEPVRLGVAGLGRGFVLMLRSLRADPRVHLVAAAAPREESRRAFEAEFGGRAYASVPELCADPEVEAVYVATPHGMHAEHVVAAAEAGRHVLVDKPLAVSLEDGARMVGAARRAGIHLIVGPSHSFDAPVELAREMIAGGTYGRLRMIQALNYTDFLYRPRRPEELRTEEGGGVLFRVFAMTGAWDPGRSTEGAYSALLRFASGTFATLTYSGYAHFDSDEWMGDVGELGQDKPAGAYGAARRAFAALDPGAEARAKSSRTYGAGSEPHAPAHHEHFGPVIALCDRADLRLTPDGVAIYGDGERSFRSAPLGDVPRRGVLDALVRAVRHGEPPVQTGEWGLASLEICHAILRSAETGQPIDLTRQVAAQPRSAA